jgi:hypothetical protein
MLLRPHPATARWLLGGFAACSEDEVALNIEVIVAGGMDAVSWTPKMRQLAKVQPCPRKRG